jgi:prolyl-tRNA synthetase
VIGDRGLKDGKIEYQGRRDAEPTLLPVDEAAAFATNRIRVGLEKGAVAKA